MGQTLSPVVKTKISGVSAIALRQIEDGRGAVLHMLRADAAHFTTFGEIYFSIVNPGSIKAWKRHRTITQRLTVPVGRVRLVIVDDRSRPSSPPLVEEIILGRPDRYDLVCIPPGLWYGFQGISENPALVANCPDQPYDPAEMEQLSVSSQYLSYDWEWAQ